MNFSEEDINKILDKLDEYFEEEEKRRKLWEEKYAWNINDMKFKNKLDEMISKMWKAPVGKAYSVGSDEDNEDFNYLESLDCYLLEEQLTGECTDFYQDEDNTFAISTTPFRYNNKVYILEHSCGQGTCYAIFTPKEQIPEHQIVEVKFNC